MSFYIYQALQGMGLSDWRLMRLMPEVITRDHQNVDLLDGVSASIKDWPHVAGVMLDGALRFPLRQFSLSGYLGGRNLLSGCFRALYSRHLQDRAGFYQMTMPELLRTT